MVDTRVSLIEVCLYIQSSYRLSSRVTGAYTHCVLTFYSVYKQSFTSVFAVLVDEPETIRKQAFTSEPTESFVVLVN